MTSYIWVDNFKLYQSSRTDGRVCIDRRDCQGSMNSILGLHISIDSNGLSFVSHHLNSKEKLEIIGVDQL